MAALVQPIDEPLDPSLAGGGGIGAAASPVQTNPGTIVGTVAQGGGIGAVATPTTTPTPTPTPTSTPAPTTPTTPTTTTTPTPASVAGFTNGQYSPQNDSVVDQVTALTSRGSPLMSRARGIGMAVANARGLQNSSIAAQSSMKSMLDAAVPIASQEAQQTYGKNLQYQQGQSASQIASMQTAASTQAAFSNALLAASQSYSANVSAIMSNPDLSASSRTSALNAAATQRDADYNMIQRVYGVSISGTGTGTGTGAGSGSTTTPAITWGNDLSHDGIPHNDGLHTSNGQVVGGRSGSGIAGALISPVGSALGLI